MLFNCTPEKIDQINAILLAAISKIRPTPEEGIKIQQVIDETTQVILRSAIPSSIKINFIEPQGSTGLKQTYLHNDTDVDLFIGIDSTEILRQKFASKTKRQEFLHKLFKDLTEHWLIPVLKAAKFDQVGLSYAEHPYISTKRAGVELDIVVCFDLPASYVELNGPITAVDRTPHHTRYIRDRLSDKQRLDVILFKQFAKCAYCYGDKSPVGRSGFIGYVAEILIDYYGSFFNLLQHFDELEHEIISTSWKNNPSQKPNEAQIAQIREKFTLDFLKILDPTDQKRNVGASVADRAYYWVKNQILAFINSPSIHYFEKEPIPLLDSLNLSKDAQQCLFYVELHRQKDEHYTKFRDKCHSLLSRFIRESLWEPTEEPRFEHVAGEILFDAEKGYYCFGLYTSTPEITPFFLRQGPAVGNEPHFSNFVEKHPHAQVKDGFVWLEVRRKFTRFVDFIQDFFTKYPIENLTLVKVGKASDSEKSIIANQSMLNFYQHVLPFLDFSSKLYLPPERF